ncbi:(S)-beta-macrocarpene synthase [Dichanthelium oligosanthes]|uniref:(S)-beta-macrocarpene synthase n=1 Tax=Dichanthelium oligosanthes TaxID=888268 RepID=A0A1E5V4I3_9POAL|nr:(S)-beta-macrocarpene synthase [Dichanthelium oligosanthes]
MESQISALKKEVRGLFEDSKDTAEQMNLVDTVQHLGIGHHFEEQIANTLCNIQHKEFNSSSLHEVSLRFRLLREHGLWVSPGLYIIMNTQIFLILPSFLNIQNHNSKKTLIFRWWKDLYAEVALGFARNRIVQLYLWSYAVYYEQEYSCARIILAKLLAMITMMDDIYDTRATLEESEKLNEAIERWDESAVSILPEYLKKFYFRILRTFKEIQDMLPPDDQYKVSYAQKSFQILSNYSLRGAEWFHRNKIPTFEDKVEVSVMDSAGPFSCLALLVGMGDVASKEALEWALGCTGAVKACGEITRYLNDITALKHGNREQDAANCVECYIAEYHVTSEVAIANICQMIEDAWKTTNKALLEHGSLHPVVVRRIFNATASLTLMYGEKKDVFTFGNDLEGLLERLFFRPITI